MRNVATSWQWRQPAKAQDFENVLPQREREREHIIYMQVCSQFKFGTVSFVCVCVCVCVCVHVRVCEHVIMSALHVYLYVYITDYSQHTKLTSISTQKHTLPP